MSYNCACIKKYFDLFVDSTDCKHIVIEDQSMWMSSTGFNIPEPFTITVTEASFNKSFDVTIDPSKRNVLSSKEVLGTIEEECIADGIYCFKTNSCGVNYTINRAYLCNTRCQIDTLISQSAGNMISDLEELEYFYKSVEINTKLGKLKVATDMFQVLQNKLEKLGCDKKNCCG